METRVIPLDVGGWKTPNDFLTAMRVAVDAPDNADLDALAEAMIRSASPCTIRITGTSQTSGEVRKEIEALLQMIDDARVWRSNHQYGAVGVTIELVP
jgi:hypothetical protein